MIRGGYTEEQTIIARDLIARKASDAECMAALGRSRNTLQARMAYHDDPKRREIVKARAKVFGKKRNRKKVPRDPATCEPYVRRDRPEYDIKLSPAALSDARYRNNAPRPLTAWICGDPPPGYSALDKRQEALA